MKSSTIRVLKLVRAQCKLNGVKCRVVEYEEDNNLGYFDYANKTLVIAKKYKTPHNRFRKNKKVREGEIALTALHELVHMWQWKRGCPNFHKAVREGDTALVEYSQGDRWHSKDELRELVRAQILMEWEADHMAIQMAKSMGVEILEKTAIRNAKIYLYAWYVLVETGVWVSPKITRYWRRLIDSTPHLDFTKDLISKLISITIKNKHLAGHVWVGKKYVKLTKGKAR